MAVGATLVLSVVALNAFGIVLTQMADPSAPIGRFSV
jgi:hypothetical protein